MIRLYEPPDDFEAEVRIFSKAEGGRSTPAFNGIRWDFAYEGDDIKEVGIFIIWPDFMDENGDSLPTDKPLPIDKKLKARMTIVVDEMREKVHLERVKVGTKFFCHEGGKQVAMGEVTRITGLFVPREFRE